MSINDDYLVWQHKIEPHACGLRPPEGFDKPYLLSDGTPLAKDWPSDVVMSMNPDNPTDLRLVDSLFNINSLMVVSERLADFLEAIGQEHVELLPLGIRDHKGKLVEASYYVLNLTRHENLLDPLASDAEASLVPGEYSQVRKGIVLRDEADSDPPSLVRLVGFGIPTLVSRALAAKFDEQGFSGVGWGELAAFKDQTW